LTGSLRLFIYFFEGNFSGEEGDGNAIIAKFMAEDKNLSFK
jgi:hypothetical protein